MSDAINPDHYKRLPAEAIEIIEAAIDKAPSNQDALLHGQALKYLLRCWDKNGIEDLRKAKWYLDRLVGSFESSKPEQSKTILNSDNIPEGYRKLKDSSEEPRQLGDLRWSVSEKRYIEIGVVEIGYANRDNWAACRKIEPVIKQSSITEPPDGWRWLEVGEVIRKGDRYFKDHQWHSYELWVGAKITPSDRPSIRRNKFEVGEKVIWIADDTIWTVHQQKSEITSCQSYIVRSGNLGWLLTTANKLAPYIEEQS